MKHFSPVIIFLISLSFLNLPGQTITEPLSLEKALKTAASSNLTLQQQQQRIQQAAVELDIQKASLYPKVQINGSYNYTSEVAKITTPLAPISIEAGSRNVYDANVMVQQPLFTGFRNINLMHSAEASLKQSEIQKESALSKIFLQIHTVYYSVQLNMLQQDVLRSSITRATNDLKTVRNFFEAGQTSAFDTLKVANSVISLKTQLNKLIHDHEILLTQLAFVLNVDKIRQIEPFSYQDLNITVDSLNSYQSFALRNRPEVSEISHQLDALTYRKKSVHSLYFPQIFAQASYHYGKPGVNFFRKEWMDYYRIGINLQWELWNRSRVSNQVKQADYSIKVLNLEEKKLLQEINQQVKQAYENLRSDMDQINFLQKLVDQEKERYRITRDKFNQGLATTLDLNDAESALTSAELQLQQSYAKWMQDRAFMEYATGRIQGD